MNYYLLILFENKTFINFSQNKVSNSLTNSLAFCNVFVLILMINKISFISKMLSYETERRLKNYFAAIGEGELQIESLR